MHGRKEEKKLLIICRAVDQQSLPLMMPMNYLIADKETEAQI